MNIRVGHLVDGKFVCMSCPRNHFSVVDRAIPVFEQNMGSYSQRCSKCRKLCFCGSRNQELFPIDADEFQFHWVDMQELLVKFDTAVREEDLETAGTVRKEMYERILKAIIRDRLHDRREIFSALERVMQTETKWQ